MSLVVEDGTGLTNADSYASVVEADAYHAAQGAPAAWSGASSDAKESGLRQATLYLDARYGQRFRGRRAHETQALKWPREDAVDDDGFTFVSTALPTRLKQATAELALKVVEGTALSTDVAATAGALASKTLKVGSLEKAESYFEGTVGQQTTFSKAVNLLRDLVEPIGIRERA